MTVKPEELKSFDGKKLSKSISAGNVGRITIQ